MILNFITLTPKCKESVSEMLTEEKNKDEANLRKRTCPEWLFNWKCDTALAILMDIG